VAFKRGAYLRTFVHAFALILSPQLTPALLLRAMSGAAAPADSDYEL
jgi:LysR family cys regulon transcriptional activator